MVITQQQFSISITLVAFCAAQVAGLAVVTNLQVPAEAAIGDSVRLSCYYNVTEDEPLEYVKWYHNRVEFYRYDFKEYPPASSSSSFINVDLTKSDQNSVYLTNVTPEASGSYKCEVLTGAPLFQVATSTKDLLVKEKQR